MKWTPQQLKAISDSKEKLIIESRNGDTEAAHGNADDILCKLLNEFGLNEITEIYNNIEKWYA